MGQQAVSPWYYYQGWDIYQDLLVKAIRPLTAEQLELKISPNLRSIGLLAKHIVRTRASWLHGFMGEGGADVAAIAAWEHGGAIPSTAELVHGLEVTFRAWQQCLERWTADDLAYVFKGEDDGEPYEITRQWVIWHVIEHDLHHGGELSFSLGAHGLAAPDL
ncbi:MAG TPA: DinB family protein [Ktedonobacteraceae bacterium]|nr:DinB family protein [Ktedonobacteraceae bacterium]